MRLLLDTHSFLWYIEDDDRLSQRAEQMISNIDNEVLLSIGSLWEIAIKYGIGKLSLSRAFSEFIPEQLLINQIDVLPISLPHLARYTELPFHHRDPFDRLIIAQAMVENIPVVSRDRPFQEYSIDVIW
ncbi:MAG: type II toxin-antitoxin system VapC family toxin [Gemmatimonadetes bacterium]|nr:type II toxin-antitoxin system VapC family toxin [Gemmatimonadota bacterium]